MRIQYFLAFNLLLLTPLLVSSQILKFEEVTKLPASINSDSEESMPLLSQDGQQLYFTRTFYKGNKGGKFAGQDIWTSFRNDTIWSLASNQLGVLNNKKNNTVIGLGADGKTLYLLDSYGANVHGIAFSRYFNGKWTKPENIPIKGLSKDGFIGYYMNPTYDVLLISMNKQDSYGQEDLYICLKDSTNQWSAPRNLGPTVNSSGYEISPFLSTDKKYLFFASNGHPGFGDADIFVSERLYNSWDIWSVPKNLGPVINSVGFDAYFTLAKDSVVYFSSNRLSDNADLYTSSLIIDKIDISQAKIDSLIREANAILAELQDIRGRNTNEVLLLFDYNVFSIGDIEKSEIELVLKKIEDKSQVVVQLNSFSFEDYSDNSKKLMISKREQSIRDFLMKKGISSVDIISEPISEKAFDKFVADQIGGVKIKISY